ncbi:Variable outer membrane protein (plasmid) [Borrelia crocidurae DOU]|uniref:Variable large protein n=1 Tax=Borrelia crocidurae DOU TaxID=1293575 RepID=W5SLN6_9SPIR|nr:variable large family protein [Borrelia crocidurae]AHH07817.1 Variable outer membrane protein [Borrelia crocidurae DOU]
MKEKKGLGEIGRREERREGRVRRRIVMVMMVVMMVMGCNSGGVAEGEEGKNKFLQSLVNVSNEFLNVFTSFGEMVGSVLGLNVNSKKSDVGKYFKTVQGTVEGIKSGLNKIVAEMKEEKNANAEATESAVKKLVSETLDKIIEGAKTASEAIGTEGNDPIGNIAAQNGGGVAGEVDNLVEGVKSIVGVVLGKAGSAAAGDDKKAENLTSRTAGAAGDGEAGKFFSSVNSGDADNTKKSAADAAKAIGAVIGADILQAIVEVSGNAVKLSKSSDGNVGVAPKNAVIAGGIALRAMAKGSKFANSSAAADDAVVAVKGAAVSAVIKALDTLTIAIRKTIDAGLKEVKEAMKINVNYKPVGSENGDARDVGRRDK